MKKTILILATAIATYGCGGSAENSANTDKRIEELEQKVKDQDQAMKEQELEAKEKELAAKEEELKQKESANSPKKSNKYLAEINDPDGYTNVRNGMSTDASIIDRLYVGQVYEVFPTTDANWWKVITPSNVQGYVHKSRVKILN
jgi:hypothetical protein